jgi:hypothetical protein
MRVRPRFLVLGLALTSAASIAACGTKVEVLDFGATSSGSASGSSSSSGGRGGSSTSSSGAGAEGTGGVGSATGGASSNGGGSATTTTTTSSTTAASSSSTAASSSSSSASSTSGYPAPFPTPPQVVSGGGPVNPSPQIYPVFFPGDDAATVAMLSDFTTNVGSTSWFTGATAEYGVGAATGHPAIMLTQAAPTTIDDSALQSWLATQFTTPNSGFPAARADTLIVLYYPTGSTITLQGQTSCQAFGGYHNSANVNGLQVSYAVVPRCNGISLTEAASHEIVEAVTDATPLVDPAFVQVDTPDLYWMLITQGGEVGDMCQVWQQHTVTLPAPFPYTVQRIWSNKAAREGHDPCVPQPAGEVYYNAAPVLPDMGTMSFMGQNVVVKSVSIPVGQSKTIPVQLYSDGPLAPWTVTATDISQAVLGAPGTELTLSLDQSTGQNGDTLMLTITVAAGATGGAQMFWLKSADAASGTHFDWYGMVTN